MINSEKLYEQMRSDFTMVSLERFKNLSNAIETVIKEKINGDLVECGVWKGGTIAYMMKILDEYKIYDKKVYGFDSFEGLPKPNLELDGHESEGWEGSLRASIDDCLRAIKRIEISENIKYEFIKGFFKDTLENNKLENISVLRLDGDWYESTMDCLNHLYPKVEAGGFIIIDDYGHWQGCKKAVDEFRIKHNITNPLFQTDYTEFWWRK